MVSNRVGPAVRGADFFGREAFVRLASETLRNQHVLLAAPRRFGKTSVMYRLMDAPAWDYQAIHLDAEHLETPAELITRLIEAGARLDGIAGLLDGIGEHIGRLAKAIRDNVDEVAIAGAKVKLRRALESDWQSQGEALFLRLEKAGKPIVVFLDELPMMLERMTRSEEGRQQAITLVRWLRSIRQRPDLSRLRFVLAGSIGIERLLDGLGEIASINDFQRLALPPFNIEDGTADRFLAELAHTYQLDLPKESRDAMIEAVGVPTPYFLQVLFAETLKAQVLDNRPPTPEHIGAIYRDRLLAVDCKTYFEHYYSRFRLYYPTHLEKAAKRLLRELAPLPEGVSRDACYQFYAGEVGSDADDNEFHGMMADLEYEFYLRYDPDIRRYRFACKLLRDWWLRHYA